MSKTYIIPLKQRKIMDVNITLFSKKRQERGVGGGLSMLEQRFL